MLTNTTRLQNQEALPVRKKVSNFCSAGPFYSSDACTQFTSKRRPRRPCKLFWGGKLFRFNGVRAFLRLRHIIVVRVVTHPPKQSGSSSKNVRPSELQKDCFQTHSRRASQAKCTSSAATHFSQRAPSDTRYATLSLQSQDL